MKRATHSITARIIEVLQRKGNENVFIEPDGNQVTAQDVLRYISIRQQQLRETGIHKGDNVLVSTGRGVTYWMDLLAIWSVGSISVPFDPNLPESYHKHILTLVSPVIFIGNEDLFTAEPKPPCTLGLLKIEQNSTDVTDLHIEDVAKTQTAAIQWTSGSTGLPKGVVLPYSVLTGNAVAVFEQLNLKPVDTLAIAIPFHFASALSHFLVAMLTGCAFAVTETKLLPKGLKEFITITGANCFGGSPLQARWIADLAEREDIGLRWIMTSGDHMPEESVIKLQSFIPGVTINIVYGLTEVGGRCCIHSVTETRENIDSVGWPIHGLSLTILSESAEPVMEGEIGEIYVAGEYMFDGYLGDQIATAEALTENGFRTGDLGWFDQSGALHVTGRVDDVFKSAGLKVSCQLISDTLLNTAYFQDIAVMAKDDPVAGAVPYCFYVPVEGKEFNRKNIMKVLRQALPSNHIPKEFKALDEIPRTGSGKINRPELKELLSNA